ncbi:MAG: serine/threonine protein kinase [Planctomycetes bacterium]|nr:serine/threonine protein kinase [Planctomycetota bacterium]
MTGRSRAGRPRVQPGGRGRPDAMDAANALFARLALSRGWISPAVYQQVLQRVEELEALGVEKTVEDLFRESKQLDEERLRVLRRLLSRFTRQARIGDYVIVRRIGAGGTGMVFEGRHRRLGRRVAIKVLFPRLEKESGLAERFLREAQVLARINHPNVVQAYDAGRDGLFYYIAMEMVPGENLQELLNRKGPLAPLESLEVLIPVARGLEAIHAAGLVHRDVKPANILLAPDGAVKLADLGLFWTGEDRQAPECGTPDGLVFGTPQYMSPEQIRGEARRGELAARSDLYSLGATWYHALTGRPPFDQGPPQEIARSHLEEEPLPPSRLKPEIPPPMEALLLRLLRKNPEDRPASARELVYALKTLAGGDKRIAGEGPPAPGPAAVRAPAPPLRARRQWSEPVPKIHPATLQQNWGRLRRRHTALGLLALFLRLIRLRRPALSGAFSPGTARRKPGGRGPRSDFRDGLFAAAGLGLALALGAGLLLFKPARPLPDLPEAPSAASPKAARPAGSGEASSALARPPGLDPDPVRQALAAMSGRGRDSARALLAGAWTALARALPRLGSFFPLENIQGPLPPEAAALIQFSLGQLSAAGSEWVQGAEKEVWGRLSSRLKDLGTGRRLEVFLRAGGERGPVSVQVERDFEGVSLIEAGTGKRFAIADLHPVTVLAWGALSGEDSRLASQGAGWALAHRRLDLAQRIFTAFPEEVPGEVRALLSAPAAPPAEGGDPPGARGAFEEALEAAAQAREAAKVLSAGRWEEAFQAYEDLLGGARLPPSLRRDPEVWAERRDRARDLLWITTRFFAGRAAAAEPLASAAIRLDYPFESSAELSDFRFHPRRWAVQEGRLLHSGNDLNEALDTVAIFRLPVTVEGSWSAPAAPAKPSKARGRKGRLIFAFDRLCIGLGAAAAAGFSVFEEGSGGERAFYASDGSGPPGAFRIEFRGIGVRVELAGRVAVEAPLAASPGPFGRIAVRLDPQCALEDLRLTGPLDPTWARARIELLKKNK